VTPVDAPRDGLPRRLAFLGRWHPNKGVDLLLDALRLLDEDDWSRIEAVRINGGGPLDRGVRSAARSLSASGRPVEVGGYLDADGAAQLLAWADYLVIPSRIESIPVVFSDAMQARCPVIAMPVGDLPQLLGRYGAGIGVDGADAPALARAIRDATRAPPSRYAAGLARAAHDFQIDLTAARVASLLLQQRPP
jgi:glycosyltransferase involved in cell wall biosynthesis